MHKHRTRIHTQELPTPEEMDALLDTQRHTEPLEPQVHFRKGCRIYTPPEEAQQGHPKAQGELTQ